MDFDNSRIIYRSNNVKIRRLIEGALIDSIPTIEGNKSFSKVDPFNLKSIVKEAGLTDMIKQKQMPANPNIPEPLIPQNNPLNIPEDDHQPPVEERQLGSRLITVNGQCIRRSHRLDVT